MVATRFTFPPPLLLFLLLSSLVIEQSTTTNAQKGSETKATANTKEVHEEDVVVQVQETSAAARSKLLRGRKMAVAHVAKTKAKNSGQSRKTSRNAFDKSNESIKSKELGSNVNGASESRHRSQPFRTHEIPDSEAAKIVNMMNKDYSHASRSRRPIHNHKLLQDNDD